MSKPDISKRKLDHITMAKYSQTLSEYVDDRFYYEPLFATHPKDLTLKSRTFLGKEMKAPIWVSSMTGGTKLAPKINKNLAKVVAEFGLGMGLGSCRPVLEDKKYFDDFNMRPILGDDRPFYANLGIAQVDQLLKKGEVDRISELVESLKADGLIIHLNPLQEWFQIGGDRFTRPPLETIEDFLTKTKMKTIVKEVGQGMGPRTLEALIKLPLAAIEFAAFGGTNFTKLEIFRREKNINQDFIDFSNVGHTAFEMVILAQEIMHELEDKALCREFIISGGIKNFLDGYYLTEIMGQNSVYGQAHHFLDHAKDSYSKLKEYVESQISGLALAETFLELK